MRRWMLWVGLFIGFGLGWVARDLMGSRVTQFGTGGQGETKFGTGGQGGAPPSQGVGAPPSQGAGSNPIINPLEGQHSPPAGHVNPPVNPDLPGSNDTVRPK